MVFFFIWIITTSNLAHKIILSIYVWRPITLFNGFYFTRSRTSNYQYFVWMIRICCRFGLIFYTFFCNAIKINDFCIILLCCSIWFYIQDFFFTCSIYTCFYWVDGLYSFIIVSTQCNLVNFFSKLSLLNLSFDFSTNLLLFLKYS